MFTKTKIALAAALVAATSSFALATEFDPNLANRYPSYADPMGGVNSSIEVLLHTKQVRLQTGKAEVQSEGSQDPIEIDRNDRASSPYAGGGF